MENFGEIKIKPTYCAKRSKHRDGKLSSIFIIFLMREIHRYFVNFFKVSGRSIKEI